MNIEALTFDERTYKLRVLDQTRLPIEQVYVDIDDTKAGFDAIKGMLVRGAPCIAAVACLSVVTELNNKMDLNEASSTSELLAWLSGRVEFLISSRPTAVNLKHALLKLAEFAEARKTLGLLILKHEITRLCTSALEFGIKANKALSEFGARVLIESGASNKLSVLTHCNTGALATVGHGTALGCIRTLHEAGRLERVYCTETRPYNQGSRLTAWELVTEKIPATLIADDMVAYLMATRKIDAVVVGADRVAANGDTANKIGTLQIAVLSKYYGVPFYIAAPTQTIDIGTRNAGEIIIEQRPADELRKIGNIQLAPDGIEVWNPCFDVTPSHLITKIITEHGICHPSELVDFLNSVKCSIGEEEALF